MIRKIRNVISKARNFFKSKPKKWFVSDLHFGHKNVITYCNRPYKDLEEMHKGLIEIWNKTVNEKDIVYVLGDFSLNPKWSSTILPLLKGVKILIPGNHDACFRFHSKEDTPNAIQGARRRYEKMCSRYLNDGWTSIHQTLVIKLKNGRNVLLSHLPYAPKEGEIFDKRYLSLRPKDEGLFLLHGHQHCHYRKYNNMIDVGIDGDLKIWNEDEIIEMINDPRDVINSPLIEWYKKLSRIESEIENMKGSDI